MYEAGSVFQTNAIQSFYGRIVEDIYEASSGADVVQYGYAYPIRGRFFTDSN
jgi:hypothetical protein